MSQLRSWVRGTPLTLLGNSSALNYPVFYHAASRRTASSESLSQLPPVTPTPLGISSQVSELSFDDNEPAFDVDFSHVYKLGQRLDPQSLSYAVKNKSQLLGKRTVSRIWRYGVHLTYKEIDGKIKQYWLCKRCHNEQLKDQIKTVDGYNHIINHMKKVHRIDVNTGLLPEVVQEDLRWSSPFDAARVAGSNRLISHTPWQEEQLQAALID